MGWLLGLTKSRRCLWPACSFSEMIATQQPQRAELTSRSAICQSTTMYSSPTVPQLLAFLFICMTPPLKLSGSAKSSSQKLAAEAGCRSWLHSSSLIRGSKGFKTSLRAMMGGTALIQYISYLDFFNMWGCQCPSTFCTFLSKQTSPGFPDSQHQPTNKQPMCGFPAHHAEPARLASHVAVPVYLRWHELQTDSTRSRG